ncbi:MAG: hypothetical protein HY770_06485, partial [Chitinivibrionia bacterium]|nr:hypothetical protein [Chitinivibrionia bacterium]
LQMSIWEERRNWDQVLRLAQVISKIDWAADFWGVYGLYYDALVSAGRGEIAEGEKAAAKLDTYLKDKKFGANWAGLYWNIKGRLELGKGNPQGVADCFKRVTKTYELPFFEDQFNLANSYLMAGDLGKAVDILEHELGRYGTDRTDVPVKAVKAHYLLGLAYEQSGWNDKAIEQYREFLDIWKDADPDLKEPADARKRLKRLEGSR